uniref:Ig-like domain-containing protein n=1 Tax=Chrysemys picta bellii TaxID=8478 RepID=A0A8C3FB75_CHRPI
ALRVSWQKWNVRRHSQGSGFINFGELCHCEISGTPPFEVAWFKDRRQVRSSKKFKVTSKDFTASVHILNLEASDTGEYQCKAMNEVGSDTCVCAVKFKGLYKGADAAFTFSFLVIVEKPGPMKVTSGDSCTLECTVDGTPELTTKWFKDGNELSTDHKYKISFFNKVSGLKIHNAVVEDSGEYSFEVKNSVGQSRCTASVRVSETNGLLGSSVVLECKVYGSPPISVSWFHDGYEVTSGDKYQTTLTDNACSLKVNSLKESDMGTYSCTATNVAGSDECSAYLTVRVSLWIAYILGSVSMSLFTCISYVENIAHLTVLNADNADSGTYTCHASNEVGKDSCAAQLSIKGIA